MTVRKAVDRWLDRLAARYIIWYEKHYYEDGSRR